MNDQDIDKLFNSGLEGKSFPFDPAAWESAEQAIMANEARKRRRAVIIWFFSGLLLLSAGLGTYQLSNVENVADKNIQKENTVIPEKNSQSEPLSAPDEKSSPKSSENEQNKNSEFLDQDFDRPVLRENMAVSPNQPSSTEESIAQSDNIPLIAFEDESKEVEDLQDTNDDINENSESTFNDNEVLANNQISFLSPLLVQPFDINDKKNNNGDKRNASNILLPEHWNTKINLIAGIMPLNEKGIENSEEATMPFYAGLGISKIHNYKIEYGAAVLLEKINYSPNEKVINQVEYGFDRMETVHSIQRLSGRYISIPIYLKYRIHINHALFAGVQYSRLIQTRSFYSVSTNAETTSSEYAEGFNNDLSDNQLSGLIGYDLTLSDRLHLQFIGRIGANSLYSNYLQESGLNDQFHLKIGLEYSLWRY